MSCRLAPVNPALIDLGYAADDRVVILHADDLGLCAAGVSSYADLVTGGLLTSASIMMPCAWAPAAAQVAAATEGSDLGIHLTLNSEWDGCRWRPLTSPADPNLVDEHGFFHRTVEEARRTDPETVGRELRAQVETALAWGIDVTHVDAHMGTAADPRYVASLLEVVTTHGIAMNLPRADAAGWRSFGLGEADAERAVELTIALEENGIPLIDHIRSLPLGDPGDHTELAIEILRDLPPGMTHLLCHPAQDTPELRALCGDFAGRIADDAMLRDDRLRAAIADLGVQLIGYRPLRDLFRTRLGRHTVG